MHHRLSLLFGFMAAVNAMADSFPEIYSNEQNKDAEPIAATEAVKQFQLPAGFNATLYASEPDVQNPIGMAWDARGRLWIAENYTYAGGRDRFDYKLRDRVIVLNDKDRDGRSDERTVFTDQLQTLTSVAVGRGGVWVMCPPQLLFIPDHDGDLVPDGEPIVKLDGFKVSAANYHNFANGLRWGPDGWLYGRCGHSCPGLIGTPGTPDVDRYPIEGGIWRYHPDREVVEVLTHGTTNPWGHDWTEHGELFFINTVNGHLWHGIPGAHFKESFGADPNPLVYERLDMHADHWHFDTSGRWQDSRGGKANEHGGGHAHIGMMIYQADQWPAEYRNRLFTLNQHGRRANVERLERHGNGYVGRHQNDVFIMGDPWYRGIDIQQGPDGSAYIIDWSDTGECHDHTGVHRTSGRIYRISHGETKSLPPRTEIEWILMTNNVWFVRQFWTHHLDVERGRDHEGIAPSLRSFADGSMEFPVPDMQLSTVQRLRSLWTLHQLGKAEPVLLTRLLNDPDEHLRAWAIRLLTDSQPIDTIYGPRDNFLPAPIEDDTFRRFLAMARGDQSGLVRLTLASTLQRLPLNQRAELGTTLAARAEDAEDHNQPAMVWYGLNPLAKHDPRSLVRVAANCRWPTLLRWISRSLATQPGPLDALLNHVTTADAAAQAAVLNGLNDGLLGWRKAPKPKAWERLARSLNEPADAELAGIVRTLGALFGDGRALDEIKRVALDRHADMAMRRAALQTLIDNRPPDLRRICESLLNERLLNTVAVKGLTLFDDPALGEALAKSYRRFYPAERPAVIEALVARPQWAMALLQQMAAGRIAKQDLPAFQARQIRAYNDSKLSAELTRVWGEVRESAAEKRDLVRTWKQRLTSTELARADLRQGRQIYQLVCANCHVLYGEGGKIGPDLTGSGRANLDYLLENIADPGAVVSADYRVTELKLKDGRTLTGIVVTENKNTLTLQQATEQSTLPKTDITKRTLSAMSMMPEGLLQALQPAQVRDLIAYLQSPRQAPLPD